MQLGSVMMVMGSTNGIIDMQHAYVAVPRKQLNQDFGTNMLLKPKLGINFKLTMAPDIPQCTLKMISIKTGPPFYVNEVK